MNDPIYRDEVGEIAGMSRRTVNRMIAAGLIGRDEHGRLFFRSSKASKPSEPKPPAVADTNEADRLSRPGG